MIFLLNKCINTYIMQEFYDNRSIYNFNYSLEEVQDLLKFTYLLKRKDARSVIGKTALFL